MQVFVDKGVLRRVFDKASPNQRTILRAFRTLWAQGHALVTSHQNIAEIWNVATRPQSARGGFGLSAAEVEKRLKTIEKLGSLLAFTTASYAVWRQLLIDHSITGVAVHDARLVAVMKTHGVSHIMTLNSGDFQRYDGIVVQLPEDIV